MGKRKKKKLEPHYSGEKSKAFWKRVNALSWDSGDQPSLYMAGVILQNLEGYVLEQLEKRER